MYDAQFRQYGRVWTSLAIGDAKENDDGMFDRTTITRHKILEGRARDELVTSLML